MIILGRNFIVLFLVLLQCFAPLVHAHVDEHYSDADRGLHLPGLESHGVALDTPILKAVHCQFASNNLIVGINVGVKAKYNKQLPTIDDSQYIHQFFWVFNAAIAKTAINFSPQAKTFVRSRITPRYSPRAPPLV